MSAWPQLDPSRSLSPSHELEKPVTVFEPREITGQAARGSYLWPVSPWKRMLGGRRGEEGGREEKEDKETEAGRSRRRDQEAGVGGRREP